MSKQKKKMGRPMKENPIKILKGIKFDEKLLREVEQYAEKNDMTFSEVVRIALREFMK